ncbi:MAG: substrate-binding domain-containing protein [Planctomycetes bacterium]|nr:substrate-binding domain-containing protein [Planctomycetota bacterium]
MPIPSRRAPSACLIGLAVAFIFGCGSNQHPDAPPAAARGAEKVRILGFVTNLPADFWNIARAGAELAMKELPGYTLEFRIGDGTAAKQKEIVEDLLVKGAVGIAISPVDAANQTAMLENAAGKTLLICQDSDAPATRRAYYIGTDNVAAGHEAAALVKEALPSGGAIMAFISKKDQQNSIERFRGLKEGLAGSNITIVDLRADDGDRARAKANAADALVSHAELVGMIGLSGYDVPAILSALTDAGKLGTIKVVGFDEEDATLAGIAAGSVQGTVVQQPFEFGYQSMKLLVRQLGGDASFIPADKHIFIATRSLRAGDVAAFAAQLKKLRDQ